jgi:hypothetical protein
MPNAPRGRHVEPVTADDAEPDAQVFQLKLRLAAEPDTGEYRVTIELSEVGVTVDVKDVDLRRAVRSAADRCADKLREHGYTVTTVEVLGALDEAIENSELVRTSQGAHLN